MSNFAERLKFLRENSGLTQQGVADILNVSRATIAGYETKGKQPDYEKLTKLAEYFNVSVDYLLGRSNTRNVDVIEEAIKDDPELEHIWSMLNNREDIRLMFKKVADLKPEYIKRILKIIEIVEDEDSSSQL